MPKKAALSLVDLDRYVNVVAKARALGAWHLVGMLVGTKPDLWPARLKKLLLATANGPQGQGNLHHADWEKLDTELETLAELLMHAIQDVHFVPLTKRKWTGYDKDDAVTATLRMQAAAAMEFQDRLPKDGAGFVREVDQSDILLHKSSVRIYLKAREVFFDKIVEAAQCKGLEPEAQTYLQYLVDALSGPYGTKAGHGLREHTDYMSQSLRVFVLGLLEESGHLGHGGEHQNVYRVLVARWGDTIPQKQLVAFGKLQQTVGDRMPECGMDELQNQAARLARIWDAIKSFTGDFNSDWKVVAMDAAALKATLVTEVETHDASSSFRINGVNRKVKEWRHNDCEVALTLEIRKRNNPDTVLVKWADTRPSELVKA